MSSKLIFIYLMICTAVYVFAGDKKIIKTNEAPEPIGPYSQAVQKGNTIYLSGQIAIDMATKQIISAPAGKQAELAMKYIGVVLKKAGFDYSNIVKTTIYLTDLNNFKDVNEVYSSFFKGDYPARETVQVSALPKGALVEISVIAVK